MWRENSWFLGLRCAAAHSSSHYLSAHTIHTNKIKWPIIIFLSVKFTCRALNFICLICKAHIISLRPPHSHSLTVLGPDNPQLTFLTCQKFTWTAVRNNWSGHDSSSLPLYTTQKELQTKQKFGLIRVAQKKKVCWALQNWVPILDICHWALFKAVGNR